MKTIRWGIFLESNQFCISAAATIPPPLSMSRICVAATHSCMATAASTTCSHALATSHRTPTIASTGCSHKPTANYLALAARSLPTSGRNRNSKISAKLGNGQGRSVTCATPLTRLLTPLLTADRWQGKINYFSHLKIK